MDIALTKDAQKMVAVLYKDYLERRESGETKAQAKTFDGDCPARLFPDDPKADSMETFRELNRKFSMKCYLNGSFVLNDDIIIFMENRFRNGLKDIVNALAPFIP